MRDAESDKPGALRTRKDGPLFWLAFDNPARMNALNKAMWTDLPKRIADAEDDEDIRVVLLRGVGDRAFSAGADISEFATVREGAAAREYDELNHTAFNAILDCAKPTVAMINGYCMGGGMEIALCCDLRYAAAGSSFAIPAVKLGIGYDPRWIQPLLAALSAPRAKEVMFTGRRFSHQEAQAMGLVNGVSGPDALEDDTRAVALDIAANAPLAVRAAKSAIDAFTRPRETVNLSQLDRLVEACYDSDDYIEGRAAFLEKRKPVFKGR